MPKAPQHIAHETLVLAESLFTLSLASRLDPHALFAAVTILQALLSQRFGELLAEEQAAIAQTYRDDA